MKNISVVPFKNKIFVPISEKLCVWKRRKYKNLKSYVHAHPKFWDRMLRNVEDTFMFLDFAGALYIKQHTAGLNSTWIYILIANTMLVRGLQCSSILGVSNSYFMVIEYKTVSLYLL